MAEKKVTRTVKHEKLYMSVDGKMVHVKKGTELTLTESKAASLGAKLEAPGEKVKIDQTGKTGRQIRGNGGDSGAKEIKALQAKLDAAEAELVNLRTITK